MKPYVALAFPILSPPNPVAVCSPLAEAVWFAPSSEAETAEVAVMNLLWVAVLLIRGLVTPKLPMIILPLFIRPLGCKGLGGRERPSDADLGWGSVWGCAILGEGSL